MQDQLCFSKEYVSERDIIVAHQKRLAAIGGKSRSEKKIAAARKNVKLATLARIQKHRKGV